MVRPFKLFIGSMFNMEKDEIYATFDWFSIKIKTSVNFKMFAEMFAN